MQSHTAGRNVYFYVFAALMVLTTTTIGVSFLDLGWMHVVAALSIAVTKAVLVLLFFMHLVHSSRLTWIVIAGAVYWLAILIVLTFSDYGTRVWM